MSEKLELSRILIVRNDSTTSWEHSTYVLEKGEFGVGYWEKDDQLLPIVKIGDGIHYWLELPQTDHLLTEDLVLSESFGRHKVENGWINAGGAGTTLFEWIRDALCQKKEKPEEIKVYPSIGLVEFIYETDTKTFEPGSKLTKIHWTSNIDEGKYIFGSCNEEGENLNTTKIDANLSLKLMFSREDKTIAIETNGFKGTTDVSALNIILEEGKTNYGDIYLTLSWSNATNYPLNSFREPMFEHVLVAGSRDKTEQITIETNNVFCFYGALTEEVTDASINSDLVHLLQNNLPTEDAEKMQTFTVFEGAKTAMIVCKTDYKVSSVHNKTAGVEMIGAFKIKENTNIAATTQMPGANYDIYYFVPAIPYRKEAEITFTLEVKANG